MAKIISVLGEWNQYATDSSIRLEAIPNCNILFLCSYLVQQEILSFRYQYIKEFSSIQTILCYILNYLIRLRLTVKVLSKGAGPGRWALKSWPSQPGIGSNTTYDTTTRVSLILDGLDHYFRIMPVSNMIVHTRLRIMKDGSSNRGGLGSEGGSVHRSEGQCFDPRPLQVACWSVLGQDRSLKVSETGQEKQAIKQVYNKLSCWRSSISFQTNFLVQLWSTVPAIFILAPSFCVRSLLDLPPHEVV